MYPDQKKDTLQSIFLDIKLIINCIGIGNLKKVLNRDKLIKGKHPTQKMYYLWFIGVYRSAQNTGIGSALLHQVLDRASIQNLDVFLETSTIKNIPWYKKFGFKEYTSLNLGYTLHFLSKTSLY